MYSKGPGLQLQLAGEVENALGHTMPHVSMAEPGSPILCSAYFTALAAFRGNGAIITICGPAAALRPKLAKA